MARTKVGHNFVKRLKLYSGADGSSYVRWAVVSYFLNGRVLPTTEKLFRTRKEARLVARSKNKCVRTQNCS